MPDWPRCPGQEGLVLDSHQAIGCGAELSASALHCLPRVGFWMMGFSSQCQAFVCKYPTCDPMSRSHTCFNPSHTYSPISVKSTRLLTMRHIFLFISSCSGPCGKGSQLTLGVTMREPKWQATQLLLVTVSAVSYGIMGRQERALPTGALLLSPGTSQNPDNKSWGAGLCMWGFKEIIFL